MQRFSSSELWGRAKQVSPLIPLLDGVPSKNNLMSHAVLYRSQNKHTCRKDATLNVYLSSSQ